MSQSKFDFLNILLLKIGFISILKRTVFLYKSGLKNLLYFAIKETKGNQKKWPQLLMT